MATLMPDRNNPADPLPVAAMAADARNALALLEGQPMLPGCLAAAMARHVLDLAAAVQAPRPTVLDGEPVPEMVVRPTSFGGQEAEWRDAQGTTMRAATSGGPGPTLFWLGDEDENLLGYSRAECEALWPLMKFVAETGRMPATRGGGE